LVFEVYEDGALIERIEARSLVGITGRAAMHRLLKLAGFSVRQEWGAMTGNRSGKETSC